MMTKLGVIFGKYYNLNRVEIEEEILEAIKEGCVRDVATGCLLWTGCVNEDGYGTINRLRTLWYVHRVIAFKGDLCNYVINRCDTLHSCDTPACCEETHISRGTHADNMHDSYQKGRMTKSLESSRNKRKLTNVQVIEIRLLLQKGLSQLEVARIVGVSRQAVWHISVDESYQDVTLQNTSQLVEA